MQSTALRPDTAHLALPFFGAEHRDIAERLPDWANAQAVDERDDRAACRDWVRRLGRAVTAADNALTRFCIVPAMTNVR